MWIPIIAKEVFKKSENYMGGTKNIFWYFKIKIEDYLFNKRAYISLPKLYHMYQGKIGSISIKVINDRAS